MALLVLRFAGAAYSVLRLCQKSVWIDQSIATTIISIHCNTNIYVIGRQFKDFSKCCKCLLGAELRGGTFFIGRGILEVFFEGIQFLLQYTDTVL